MFKVNNKDTRTTPVVSFWCLSTPCSSVSIVNFEHVIASWDGCYVNGQCPQNKALKEKYPSYKLELNWRLVTTLLVKFDSYKHC